MANKYYAVKNGRNSGIFNTWDKCKSQVIGYSGAVYKSFLTLEEAEEYLGNNEKHMDKTIDKMQATAYVDGSYNIKTKEFSCGVIVFYEGKTYEISKKFCDKELCEMRNVAGEIKGSEMAIRFCLDNNIKSINIYHDYEGVARWCDKSWKANKKGTQEYAKFCDNAKKYIKINFTKVKGHSGDKYNDRADRLAKDALGIK